jgi:hypothetical protein
MTKQLASVSGTNGPGSASHPDGLFAHRATWLPCAVLAKLPVGCTCPWEEADRLGFNLAWQLDSIFAPHEWVGGWGFGQSVMASV